MIAQIGVAPFDGFDVTAAAIFAGSSYDAYGYTAPDALPGLAFEGGWATPADIGPDLLYSAPAGTQELTPLVWGNPELPAQYHVNDPSIVAPLSSGGVDRSGWAYMYFTQLSNQYASFVDITTHNEIGFAASFDGGHAWLDLGRIADGWAPSALQTGDKIDIFYHTPAGQVQVIRADQSGWAQPQAPQSLIDVTTGAALQAVNVSVAQAGDRLAMVGNGFGNGAQFGDIVAYTANAADPLHWTPLLSSGPVLVHGSAVQLLTPEIKMTGATTATITFSENQAYTASGMPTGLPQTTYTMQWGLQLSAKP